MRFLLLATSLACAIANAANEPGESQIVSTLPKVELPLEVLGAAGTTRDIQFNVSGAIALAGDASVEARIYGLEYEDMGEIILNGASPILLRNSTVVLEKHPKAWGGIGGAYSTLDLKIPVPLNSLKRGVNTLQFRFRNTDGFSLGYRVLKVNVAIGGSKVLKDADFSKDNPKSWTAPLSSPSDIAAGKVLWESAPLVRSPLQPSSSMAAKCAHCHASDGYDLKYFNFSNHSIIERSKFHGLTEQQGKQIASYIRSLNVPNPGRPWNPPYQPGPGIDSKPVNEWAAGAGIDWVLKDDTDMLKYLYSDGKPKPQDLKQTKNQREIPVAVELPSWNQWLPRVHPLDGYGEKFSQTAQWLTYEDYKNNPKFLGTELQKVNTWRDFHTSRPGQTFPPNGMTPIVTSQGAEAVAENARIVYSFVQWTLVKRWEVARHFELEGLGDVYTTQKVSWNPFPASVSSANNLPNPRTWGVHNAAFNVAPHMCKLPKEGNAIRRGNAAMWDYFSLAWYHLQLVLTDNHRTGDGATHWPYTVAFTSVCAPRSAGEPALGFPVLRFFTIEKYNEAYFNHYRLTEGPARAMSPSGLYRINRKHPESHLVFNTLPNAQYMALVEAHLRSWLDDCKSRHTRAEYAAAFPDQFDGGKYVSIRGHLLFSWSRQFFDALTEWKSNGLDSNLLKEAAEYGKQLWPADATEWDNLHR